MEGAIIYDGSGRGEGVSSGFVTCEGLGAGCKSGSGAQFHGFGYGQADGKGYSHSKGAGHGYAVGEGSVRGYGTSEQSPWIRE